MSKRLQQCTKRADEKGTKYKPLDQKKLKNPKTNVWSSDPCLEIFHKQQKREIFNNLFTIFIFHHFSLPFSVIIMKNSIYFKKGKTWNGTQTQITRGTCLLTVVIINFLSIGVLCTFFVRTSLRATFVLGPMGVTISVVMIFLWNHRFSC